MLFYLDDPNMMHLLETPSYDLFVFVLDLKQHRLSFKKVFFIENRSSIIIDTVHLKAQCVSTRYVENSEMKISKHSLNTSHRDSLMLSASSNLLVGQFSSY